MTDIIKVITGDLLDLAEQGQFDVIVQGCNCQCTMGSGIARQIRDRYPTAYSEDLKTIPGDYNKLGTITRTTIAGHSSFDIVNAYTQFGFNRNWESNDVFEYDAFKLILQKLLYLYPGKRLGFPMIGMGLARGNKERIMSMLMEFGQKINDTGGTATVVEFGKMD
jgi:O-acetyl-ADP-ribose deacetylase (regulator of RNase III)